VTAWSCCDAPIVYSYHNLLTGKKIYVSNTGLLEVEGDVGGPEGMRYVAFGYSSLNKLSQPHQLQYGTDKENLQLPRRPVRSATGGALYEAAPSLVIHKAAY